MDHTTARRRLRVELSIIVLVGLLTLAALAAGAMALYKASYSPSAYVERYLDLIAEQRATDALLLPGVALDREQVQELGLTVTASDVLLRGAALAALTEVEIVGEVTDDEGVAHVTARYLADGNPGTSTFAVVQNGWIGVVPDWRFARSPLAVVDLVVRGENEFSVNDFTFDRRQVAGVDSDPLTPISLLVLVPGSYTISVDTAVSRTDGVQILAEEPGHTTVVDVQSEPTEALVATVQENVEQLLNQCAEQTVLLPTLCPFGYPIDDRLDSEPSWSIAQQPVISLVPDGAHWQIETAEAIAHIEVDVRLISDGSLSRVSEDVPFFINGPVTLRADGTIEIKVGSPG